MKPNYSYLIQVGKHSNKIDKVQCLEATRECYKINSETGGTYWITRKYFDKMYVIVEEIMEQKPEP